MWTDTFDVIINGEAIDTLTWNGDGRLYSVVTGRVFRNCYCGLDVVPAITAVYGRVADVVEDSDWRE